MTVKSVAVILERELASTIKEWLKQVKLLPDLTSTREWRRGWDLNPRYPLRYVRFRGGSFQPLTHLSGCKNMPLFLTI